MQTAAVSAKCQFAPGTLLAQIGGTPLIRLGELQEEFADSGVEIYAKAEWFNPGGSVKDRAALRIVCEAEEAGLLGPGKTILESTSGNTGIALSMIGAAKGYPVEIVMPSNASQERRRTIESYGAKLILSSPFDGSDGAQKLAYRLSEENSKKYFYANQYGSDSNWRAHYDGTGVEILSQTRGRVTHFVTGVGTGGTIMGVGRRLRERNPDIKIISVEPDESFHGIEGLKHMASSIKPDIFDPDFPDEKLYVSTGEAYDWVHKMAKEHGLFVGLSSGASVSAALKVASRIKADGGSGVIVTVFPDGGARYLSMNI